MFLKALLLIIGGVLFLILALVSLIFMIIGLANNKPYKFFWMGSFFVSLLIGIACVVVFVRKTTQTIENFSEKIEQRIDLELEKGMKDNPVYHADTVPNEQVVKILSFVPDSLKKQVPGDFYYYLGYRDYYRVPVRYPYAIHCIDAVGQGDLFNEKNVVNFDQNDNGELDMRIGQIGSIAYDDRFLLIEFSSGNSATSDYLLFEFDKESKTSAQSLKKLLELAKRKGYKGPEKLIPLKDYYDGFF